MDKDTNALIQATDNEDEHRVESDCKYTSVNKETEVKDAPIVCCCRYVVEPALFFYVTFGNMIKPLASQFIYAKIAQGLGPNYTNLTTNNQEQLGCNSSLAVNNSYYSMREFVQKNASQFSIYQALVGMIPLIFMSMIYGAYSDRVGRKFLMILSIMGSIVTCLAFIITIKCDLSVYYLFIQPLSDSFLGNPDVFIITTVAFMADTCAPTQRGFRITVLDVFFLFGEAFSNLIAGYMIKGYGFFWPFILSLCGCSITLIYVILYIPNTYPKRRKDRNICSYVAATTKVYAKSTPSGRRWKLFLLAWPYIVIRLGRTTDIRSLFELNAPLCWGSVTIGIFKAVYAGILGFGALFGSHVLDRFMSYEWIAVVGFISGALEYFYLSVVKNTLMMMFVPVLGTVHILPLPMIRAIMSNLVEADETGAMLAGIFIASRLADTISKLALNPLYQATLKFMVGFVFLVTGITYIIGLLSLLLYIFLTRNSRSNTLEISSSEVQKDKEEIPA